MKHNGKTVAVTGISGYVGKWVAHSLLAKGYAVRGTLRDMSKQAAIENTLRQSLGDEILTRLSFAEAELLRPDDWHTAFEGVDAVMHVATRVVGAEPKDPESVILPAIEGTRNVLEAAHALGVPRVIMTSSIATIGYGHGQTSGTTTYTEENWTDLENMRWSWAYCIGKTRAEREAWAYAKQQGIGLTTVHPGMILGPPLDVDSGISIGLIIGLLKGEPKAYPNLGFALSDVRDVAEMHVAALESADSVGQRYLCTSRYIRFDEIADMLREAYPKAPVPKQAVPDWLMRVLVYWHRDVRQIINDIGNEKHFDGSKGRALLRRDYRTDRQTIIESAESLYALGLVSETSY